MSDDLETQIKNWVQHFDHPIPLENVQAAPNRRLPRARAWKVAAAAVVVVTVVGVWAASATSPADVDTAAGPPAETLPAPTDGPGQAQPSPTPTQDPAPHLIVDIDECVNPVAYEMNDAGHRPSSTGPRFWYHRPADDLAGGVAVLTFAEPQFSVADLAGENVERRSQVFPDDTAVVEWREGDRHLALLSTKRLSASETGELADAIAAGTVEKHGFGRIDSVMTGATVEGYSCSVAGEFVGVEVVEGPIAAQLAYIADTDPTAIDRNGSYTVLTFNHLDGSEVPLQAVTDTEWQELRANAPTSDTPEN